MYTYASLAEKNRIENEIMKMYTRCTHFAHFESIAPHILLNCVKKFRILHCYSQNVFYFLQFWSKIHQSNDLDEIFSEFREWPGHQVLIFLTDFFQTNIVFYVSAFFIQSYWKAPRVAGPFSLSPKFFSKFLGFRNAYFEIFRK